MKRTFNIATSLVALALCCTTYPASAQGKQVINAITTTNYPPFEYKDLSSNKLVGFDIDLLDAMAERMKAKVNWIESSFEQVASFAAIKTKGADVAIAQITDTTERRTIVNFLDYMNDNQVLFTRREDIGKYTSMEAVCGRRVTAPRASKAQTEALLSWSEENCVKTGKPAVELIPSTGSPEERLMIKQGRVDAALMGAAALAYQNTLEGKPYARFGKPLSSPKIALAFAKGDEKFGAALAKALADIIEDGTYLKLLRKWEIPEDVSIQRATLTH